MGLWTRGKRNGSRKSSQSRKGKAGTGRSWNLAVPAGAAVIGLAFIAAASVVIIIAARAMPWRLGQRPGQDIRVRCPFKELDEQGTVEAREQARQSTPNYYHLNLAFVERTEQDVTSLYTDLKAAGEYEAHSEAKRKELKDRWGISAQNFASLRDAPGGKHYPNGGHQRTGFGERAYHGS